MSSVRFCANCKLTYEPDPRIYKDPHEYCPRCGANLEQSAARWKEGGELDPRASNPSNQ